MVHEDISLAIDQSVARITIRRPDKLNAMRCETAEALRAALDAAARDKDVRAAILTGEGRAFGVGYDLSTVAPDETPDLGRVLEDYFNPLTRQLRASRLPIVSAINGPCAGVSVALALSGDIVIAARSAYLYEPFVGISVVPDGGNSFFLPRIAGRIRASAAILLGDRISAAEAASWGLIWRVYDDEELIPRAAEFAERLAALSPATVTASKRLISAATEAQLDSHLDLERDAQAELGQRPEFREAISKFFARNKQ